MKYLTPEDLTKAFGGTWKFTDETCTVISIKLDNIDYSSLNYSITDNKFSLWSSTKYSLMYKSFAHSSEIAELVKEHCTLSKFK